MVLNIYNDIYPFPLTIFIGSDSELKRHLARKYKEKDPSKPKGKNVKAEYFSYENDAGAICGNYIHFAKFIDCTFYHAMLVHEVFHYAFDVMGSCSVKVSPCNNEAMAYFLEATYLNSLNAILNTQRKKAKKNAE